MNESGIKFKTAVIYGNGGVSGVAYQVLSELGIKATMTGRNPEHVAKKRRELGIDGLLHLEGPYDLVVDATPISSDPDFLNAAGFSSLLKGCKAVFSHNMPEKDNKQNHLMQYCAKNGIYFIPGRWMYVNQMVEQFKLYLKGFTKKDGSRISEADIINAWGLN